MLHLSKEYRVAGRLLNSWHQRAQSSVNTRSKTTSSSSDDYQYLQWSKLPTMHFQKSLPRLPIPLLEKTCERYLAAVQPLLTAEAYKETESSVQAFRQGVGMELHSLLKQHDSANKHTSYISEPWFDMYLSDRKPLPLNYNPLLVMKNDPRSEYQQQLLRATNLVISSLRFWRSLQAYKLEPEVYHMNPKKSDTEQFRRWTGLAPSLVATYVAYTFKAFPLDMSQFQKLFGVSRIPEVGKDRLHQSTDSKHILVMRGGNFFAVDVLDEHGQIAQPSEILGRLKAVMDSNGKNTNRIPIGVLTSGERDSWALSRSHLTNKISSVNKDLLEREIDSALFCLCLDSEEDGVYDQQKPTPMLKHLLAGNARNRWFDKSVSLIVSADGTAAINFEHSWGDGVAVLRYFNEIFKETTEKPFVHPETNPITPSGNAVRPINFDVDEKLEDYVKKAISANDEIINSLDMNILRFPNINKGFCKNNAISPDSIMQLSFQLAYRQLFSKYVGTYESCSTSAFRHGRTETVRPCTIATKAFCESILMPSAKRPTANELRAMIDQCSATHGQLTKEAAMGQGFDRHLFALKSMAIKHNMEIPKIYTEDPYRIINHNIISTSTLASNALEAGAFGPVVTDGLGVGYSIQNDECGAIVTSYKNGAKGGQFIESLGKALTDIHSVISSSRK